jgi:hypothetical protein
MRGRYTPISGPYLTDLGRLIGRMLLRAPADQPSAAQSLSVSIIHKQLPEGPDPTQAARREEVAPRRMERKGAESDDGDGDDDDDAAPARPRGRSPAQPGSNAGDAPQGEAGDPRRFWPPPELMESICAAGRQREWRGDGSGDEASEGDV